MRWGTVVVFVVALVFTLSIGYLNVYQPQQRIDAAELTNATVISSNVDRIERSNERDRYCPNITYQYDFEGERYTSNNYFPGSNRGPELFSRPVARDRADTFQSGQNVTAYVNPESPSQAYLLNAGHSRGIS